MSSATPETPAESDAGKASQKQGKGRRVAGIAVTLIVLCALVWLGWWFLHRNEITTDDAYIQANIGQIAPRVTGTVTRILVDDNDHVHKGELLFTLDPADFKAALDKAKANLEAARASYNASQKDLAVTRLTSAADINNAKAALSAAQAEAQRARADAARYRALFKKHEVSRQQLDQKNTQAKATAAKVRQAKAQLAQAEASPDRIQLKQAQASSAHARIAQAKAELEQARLNLSYTKIRAQHDGRVAKKSIVVGSQISTGQAAMALVEDGPWVVANYKETQLYRIRPGLPVSIHVDAYPNHDLEGRVQSIQPGSGVTFSLLPPENATGNYVKIVQRVPVKIIFSHPKKLRNIGLSPGLSVVSTINAAGDIKPVDDTDDQVDKTTHSP